MRTRSFRFAARTLTRTNLVTEEYIISSRGPVPRQGEWFEGVFNFQPNEFVNVLFCSVNYVSIAQLKNGCNLGAGRLLEAAAFSEVNNNSAAVLRVTRLSEEDPRFLCFHRDNHDAATVILQGVGFEVSHDVYRIRESHRIVGNAACSAPGQAINPQCTTNFQLGGGLVRMAIGPFSAVNLTSFLGAPEPITSRLFSRARIDFSAIGVDVPVFDLPVEIDPAALTVMESIGKVAR